MWDRYPARPPPLGAPIAAAKTSGQGKSGESGSGRGRGGAGQTAITGLQLMEGATMGLGSSSGGGGGAGGRSHRASSATTTTNTTSSNANANTTYGQKKLTPPPQLHERGFLNGQQYRQSHLQPRSQFLTLSSLPSQSGVSQHRSYSQLQQHLNNQREHLQQQAEDDGGHNQTRTQTQTQTQHFRLQLRGGSPPPQGDLERKRERERERQGQGQGQGQQVGTRASVRNNFPYADSNRNPAASAASALNSTSTLHHQNYWPDNFKNSGGGLRIEHNLPSPTTSPKDESKRGAERIQSPQDTLEDLLPPPSLQSTSWRPASSVYSLQRDSYASTVTPNFANVAAHNIYTSAVADISPPSSPELDAQRIANPPQHRSVSPIQDAPNMSQLALQDQRSGQNGTPPSKSNIPMMRRERRKNQDAAAHTLRETKSQQLLRIQRETKWDDMTGEPTSLDTGRAGQVRPQEYAQGLRESSPFGKSPAAMKAMQNAPQTQQPFGDRMRRLRPVGGKQDQESSAIAPAAAAAPDTIDERPPWRGASGLRGASGRTAIVSPVRDTTPKEPLSIPRRSSKRIAVGPRLPIAGLSSPLSPVSPSGPETSPRTKTPTIRTVLNVPRQLISSPSPPASVAPSSPDAVTRTPPPAQSSYPSPPNSGSAGVQSSVQATPEASTDAPVKTREPASLPGLPAAPNAHLGHDKAIRRKPPPANSQALHAPQLSYSSSVYSEATVHAPSAPQRPPPRPPRSPGEALKANEPLDQPPSRFSVTTYATSAASTPRPSTDTAPPVPALPSPQQADGVMSRKRPPVLGHTSKAVNADQPFVISLSSPYLYSTFPKTTTLPARSELPSQKRPLPRASSSSMYSTSSRPDSAWTTSKALPPPPTEISMANDRIGYLNARLESLGNRRININQAIKQMTQLMPTDSILASEAVLRKREAEKRKVEALKVELSEVQREEYEIGLKLHRAYKRMDRNAEYEPTTLWVRRVTG